MDRERLVKAYAVFMKDFYLFVEHGLGIRENELYGYKDMTSTHGELCRFMMREDIKTKMVLMPRYSLKSTITTIGWVLWRLVRNANERILIYSDSAGKASGFLNGIKAHIEGKAPNSSFREYFPEWETDPRSGKWNEGEIIISTRKVSFPEPSVDTGGIESSKVGKHYDTIVFDDIVSDLNVTTKAQMDKVYECYQKSLSLLKPGGDVVITGTRWSFGDAYGRILAENQDNKKFGSFVRAIEENGTYPFEAIGLDGKFLAEQRRKQGNFVVSCLYFNNPVNDEDAVFKNEYFRFYNPDEVDTSNLYVTCTCDPAGEGEDFTAISVIGTDNEMNMYILELVNEHLNPSAIVDKLVRLNYKWKYKKLGVETNFFRGLLEREIKIACDTHRSNKDWEPFSMEIFQATAKRGESKHNRIMALQPYHERGSILFPCRSHRPSVEALSGPYMELAMQMIQYTVNHRPAHDDLCDSLAYQLPLIRKGGKNPKKDLPKNSIASIIKKDYEAIMSRQKRLPLKYRRFFEPFIE